MVPVLDRMIEIQSGPIDPLHAMAKINAGHAIDAIRPLLFPDDDDG